MTTTRKTTNPATPKTRLRDLLRRYDRMLGAYADALIDGRERWAEARKRRADALARRIAALATRHGLEAWTRQQLKKD